MSTFSQDPQTLGAREIELDSKFTFTCMSCGNCCCDRSNQIPGTGIFLSGPDIQRMANHLHCSNIQFIDQYAKMYYDSEKRLTFCQLRMRKHDGSCCLLRKGKCQIYEARPRTCALYPLGRGFQFSVQDSEIMSFPDVYCINEPESNYECGTEKTYTVRQWLELNDVPIDDAEDRRWYQLVVELSEKAMKVPVRQAQFQRQAFFDLYTNWRTSLK